MKYSSKQLRIRFILVCMAVFEGENKEKLANVTYFCLILP